IAATTRAPTSSCWTRATSPWRRTANTSAGASSRYWATCADAPAGRARRGAVCYGLCPQVAVPVVDLSHGPGLCPLSVRFRAVAGRRAAAGGGHVAGNAADRAGDPAARYREGAGHGRRAGRGGIGGGCTGRRLRRGPFPVS